jgi:phosphoribosylpyrophosphate synthetase
MLAHLKSSVEFGNKIVVVSPNAESIAKARKFQLDLGKSFSKTTVKLAAFFHVESTSGPTDPNKLTLLTSDKEDLSVRETYVYPALLSCLTNVLYAQVDGADIVIVDDIIDSATTLSVLAARLHQQGARNIYVCASHGLFTENSMKLIDEAPVTKVFVSNSLPLPRNPSAKVQQVSIAHLLADVIIAEHFRKLNIDRDEEFTYEED